MILKSFTKKGYYCGRKDLVFKSAKNESRGDSRKRPALEDFAGYVVHACYTITSDPKEQFRILIAQFKLTAQGKVPRRVFDEEGLPYEMV